MGPNSYEHTKEYYYNLGITDCEEGRSREPVSPNDAENYRAYADGFCKRMEENNYELARPLG